MSCQRAFSIVRKVWDAESTRTDQPNIGSSICAPTRERRSKSLSETPLDAAQLVEEVSRDENVAKDTVLYLAYGSNLCAETFKGARGIKPLSQVNVLVPELKLTFDLPGIPFSEPCFANTRYRTQPSSETPAETKDYHKDRWHKGLVGVVYEVTKADYATIIATEGGGSGYQDIIVQCYEILKGSKEVDPHPSAAPFKAHTLFAPALPPSEPGTPPPASGGRISRPDPSYAQPSARYLKHITDGAEEHNLPNEYKEFLYQLRPYTITSIRQRLGQFIFLGIWMPIIIAIFTAGRVFEDKNGRLPKWMIVVRTSVFTGVWASYDNFFKRLFGDGERTQKGERDEKAWTCGTDEKQPLLWRDRSSTEGKGLNR